MTHAEILRESAIRLELAITENNLDFAHQIMDERLMLLQQLTLENSYSIELIEAAKETLNHNEKLMLIVSQKKVDIQRRLHDVVIADKATQLYKVHSR
ncbi:MULTISPECIES: hypothetical protein [Aeromonas]|uniref:hypothetical protein n=1 Tax=Aeromonas TaxID=642 RepID=UPI000FB0C63D|nr:hypothetical protein [Aeromonas media]WOQ11888.1 hypothetical protein R2X36_13360 [Aeromonas media]